MRYLTVAECRSLGEPGSQDEVTPAVVDAERVISVRIYTQLATYRSSKLIEHGSPIYETIIRRVDREKSDA